MDTYLHIKFERNPPSRLRDLENRVFTCARADALHLRHVLSSYPNGFLFTHKIWTRSAQPFARSGKRGLHVSTCRAHVQELMCKALIEWVPIHSQNLNHQNLNMIRPAVCEIWKRGVHVRTCRFTPPLHCVKEIASRSPNTRQIWT